MNYIHQAHCGIPCHITWQIYSWLGIEHWELFSGTPKRQGDKKKTYNWSNMTHFRWKKYDFHPFVMRLRWYPYHIIMLNPPHVCYFWIYLALVVKKILCSFFCNIVGIILVIDSPTKFPKMKWIWKLCLHVYTISSMEFE